MIKNIIIRSVLTIPLRFRSIIILPLLTRLYTQEIYGAWLQIILITEVLSNILSLQLGVALVRYLSAEKEPKQSIRAVFTVTLGCFLCFLFLIWLFGKEASRLMFGNENLQQILLIASFWIFVKTYIKIGLSVLRSLEKIGTISIRELISALWLIFAVSVSYLIGLEIQKLILICMVGDTILLIWILVQLKVPFPLLWVKKSIVEVKKFLPFSLPLVVSAFFLWFTRSIDRLQIVNILGLASVGIYGVSLQVSAILSTILQPIGFVLFPRVSAAWNQKNRAEVSHYFSQAFSLIIFISAPIIVGLFIVSDGLIPLLAGQNYTTSKSLILFLLLSWLAYMLYQNHLYVIHLMEKTYILPVLFIFTALVNYVLNYLLILKIGIIGAATARLVTFWMMAFIITFWARKYIKFSIPWAKIFRAILISVVMGLSISWMPLNTWTQILTAVAIGTAFYFVLLIIFRVLTFKNISDLKIELIKKPLTNLNHTDV